jgi:prolyl-tRNA editing enzyme YbaK/EbsC (Cys-tRNA(Pro) deacylase)
VAVMLAKETSTSHILVVVVIVGWNYSKQLVLDVAKHAKFPSDQMAKSLFIAENVSIETMVVVQDQKDQNDQKDSSDRHIGKNSLMYQVVVNYRRSNEISTRYMQSWTRL